MLDASLYYLNIKTYCLTEKILIDIIFLSNIKL